MLSTPQRVQWTHEDSQCNFTAGARNHVHQLVHDVLTSARNCTHSSLKDLDSEHTRNGNSGAHAATAAASAGTARSDNDADRRAASDTDDAHSDIEDIEDIDDDDNVDDKEKEHDRDDEKEVYVSASEFTDAMVQHFMAASTPHLTNPLDEVHTKLSESDGRTRRRTSAMPYLDVSQNAMIDDEDDDDSIPAVAATVAGGRISFCDYRPSVKAIADGSPGYVFESSECGATMSAMHRDVSAYFPVAREEYGDGTVDDDARALRIIEKPQTQYILEEANVERICAPEDVPKHMLAPMSMIGASDAFWDGMKKCYQVADVADDDHTADQYITDISSHRDTTYRVRNRDGAVRRPTNRRTALKQTMLASKRSSSSSSRKRSTAEVDDTMSYSGGVIAGERAKMQRSQTNSVTYASSALHDDVALDYEWRDGADTNGCAWLTVLRSVACFRKHGRAEVSRCAVCATAAHVYRFVECGLRADGRKHETRMSYNRARLAIASFHKNHIDDSKILNIVAAAADDDRDTRFPCIRCAVSFEYGALVSYVGRLVQIFPELFVTALRATSGRCSSAAAHTQ